MVKKLSFLFLFFLTALFAAARQKSLHELQQAFVDLRFGMFIHYNMPTYSIEDWPDPDMPVSAFAPTHLDCRQWAKAAKAAGMSYGCLTTKHHSGFCIWDTKTTDYNSMQSPAHVDVVRQYVDAFREEGLSVMLYYSILDTHHRIRPGHIKPQKHTDYIKAQLHELLTGYGDITALIIDGWDAPWSRIPYDEISFPEIYDYVKSLQPNCLLMDLNAAKYPREALFYTDIKSYEQGAGQKISTTENRLPALACLSIQRTWFWKESMPTDQLKDVKWLVEENIRPYNNAYCNFILNVAPNREGLMDDNAVEALRQIGRLWQNEGPTQPIPECDAPITLCNIAKGRPTEYSWSDDYGIGDFANDDDFGSAWTSHPSVSEPWWEVDLQGKKTISLVTIVEGKKGSMQAYRLEYKQGKRWQTLFEGTAPECRVKQHRFAPVKAEKVRITITRHQGKLALAEVGVY
ncbi:MAG: alpha-L-fucosidase [Bacteroidaceae bacterium]|nr:alpha-L-fucosidase [Bacteroidaceae bacterium]